MAPPHPQVTWPRTPQTGHVLSTVRRTAPQSLFSGQCCDVHPEILGHLQQLSWQQAQVLERLDTLIAVLSGPSEYISPIHSPVTASPNSTTPQHAGQQTDILEVQLPRGRLLLSFFSEQKQCLKRTLQSNCCGIFFNRTNWKTGRAVSNKEALNQNKIAKIRELVFCFFSTSLSQQENLGRDCRKAIDSYLQNRKQETRSD